MRRSAILLPVTFLAAILLGTGALLLPGMATDRVGVLEAFFTSTSAVCVTGLIVVDTGADFTRQGQIVIAVLIQLGGLGIMTFGVLAIALVGGRVRLDQEAAVREGFTHVARWRVSRLVLAIVGLTLAFEAIGAALLWNRFDSNWSAIFHSVSAFCNAGFSLYDTSLQSHGPGVLLPVLVLFVLGGLGFTTLIELLRNARPQRDRRRRLSLHARLVLKTTFLLLGVGTLLLGLAMDGAFADAFFMGASARTAGFDSTPVGALPGAALLLLIPLMLIGASPGSTGGGIKTTTFALALLHVRAVLRGHERITIDGRELPQDQVRRMFAIVACSFGVVFLATFLLFVFEGGRQESLLGLAFEAVSAFATVGLSTGVTPDLTAASKILLCVVMFVGRIGSLSLFLVIVRETKASRVRYPEERILIG